MNIKLITRNTLSIIAFCGLAILAAGSSDDETASSTIDLKTAVEFDGSQFIIKNRDSFNWTNVKLEVNSRGLKSGYILKTQNMFAGETYTVGAMQFAKKSGEKFNPFTHKPLNFSISCTTPKGDGFYYGSWE